MRKVLLTLLVFLSTISILINFGYQPFIKFLGLEPRAGIKISANERVKVLIDGKEAGRVPFQDENLKEGEYLFTLVPDEASGSATEASNSGKILWQGYARLYGGTLTVINREISNSPSASSGEVITLEKGKGGTIISNPPEAEVMVDGQVVGRTPIVLGDLSVGEHQFIIGKEGYLKRSIKATSLDGYNLTLSVDLAITEPDLTKLPTVPITETKYVKVKPTPTGFLRVRSAPNLNSTEIGRLKPGEELVLLDELPNWSKVRMQDGKEGYVSSSFVEKKQSSTTVNSEN